uniref:Small ubiquitin-related modifier 3 n=2 Tax=Xenopus TaxID=8353 RepID=A0A803K726_XENTR
MSEEKPKEGVKTENDHINLKVAGQDGSVVQFKIKRHTPLSKLMKAYCDRQGLSMRQIRFRFDGQPINETDTPAQLERDVRLCVSSISHDMESIEEDRPGESSGDSSGSPLAEAPVVSVAATVDGGDTVKTSSVAESAGTRPSLLRGGGSSILDGLEIERQGLLKRGCQEELLALLLKSRKTSTSAQYYRVWSCFAHFALAKDSDPRDPDSSLVVKFLFSGYKKGFSNSTLKGQVSALSALTERAWSEDPLVKRFFNALKRIRPYFKPRVPPWDLPLVLKALMSTPFEPLEKVSDWHATLKVLLLVAITSACRVGELCSLSAEEPHTVIFEDKVVMRPFFGFLPKVVSQFHAELEVVLPSFCSNPKSEQERLWHTLDLVRAISSYLERTSSWRKTSKLFVIPRGPRKGLAPSKVTVSRWIVSCIVFAYQLAGREVPKDLKAHSTRAMATSWAAAAKAPPEAICRAARWSSATTFVRHYKLDVFQSQEARFGRKILQAVIH